MTSPTVTAVSELKPCPFCGRSDTVSVVEYSRNAWSVVCGNRKCLADIEGTSREDTIARWNRRSALADVGECETCGGKGTFKMGDNGTVVDWPCKCQGTGKQPRPAALADLPTCDCVEFCQRLTLMKDHPDRRFWCQVKKPRPAAEVCPYCGAPEHAPRCCQESPAAEERAAPSQQRLCELMDICRPHVEIGLEVRAELRRALMCLYKSPAAHTAPDPPCATCNGTRQVWPAATSAGGNYFDRPSPCPDCKPSAKP